MNICEEDGKFNTEFHFVYITLSARYSNQLRLIGNLKSITKNFVDVSRRRQQHIFTGLYFCDFRNYSVQPYPGTYHHSLN
ncbi:hypothetical protein HanXRQr2_Chr01g0004111 [Helianthus annuus]|uniref:Uncharacterized protein n=1 Tax=Helianthus annuus TaxID=4232 RepID=A0A9K3P1Q0_HELAN|nr:hypothetical protein HanXRQr2_Chr01g0004111 [Helianthus annuus]